MARRLSRAERLRSERRGAQVFVDAERDRLNRNVYADHLREHVEERIAEHEDKIREIDEELGQDDVDQVLDDEREELDVDDYYATDEEAQADDFNSAKQGNDYWLKLQEELLDEYNRSLRVDVMVTQDLASEGVTKNDLFDAVQEWEDVQEQMWRMFGVE